MEISEELMRYDKTYHRFVLTPKGCADIDDITKVYGNERNALRTLESISRTIYNYIYSHNATGNKPFIEYLLAKNKDLKVTIFEAMRAQLEADISSGYNDVKNQVGINFKTSAAIKDEYLRNRLVCNEAKMILESAPYNIMSSYFMSRRYQELSEDRYERFDY